MRVVSLLPSATEILCLIGGEHLLVGRSHECDYPPGIGDRPILTAPAIDPSLPPAAIDRTVADALSSGRSLYRLDTPLLRELRPDVILTQDLCRVCSIDLETVRAAAADLDPPPRVVSLNPGSVEGVFDDIITVGSAVGMDREARAALVHLRERFFTAADHVNAFEAGPRVVLLEWCDPLFVGGHWTPQLIERAGGEHPLNPTVPLPGAGAGAGGQMAHRIAGPSVRVTPEQVAASSPEVLIVCPCGVRLEDVPAHMSAIRGQRWFEGLPAVRDGRVALVDGNQMFNRPGPRLVDAYEWLVGWLHGRPWLIPQGFPWVKIPVS